MTQIRSRHDYFYFQISLRNFRNYLNIYNKFNNDDITSLNINYEIFKNKYLENKNIDSIELRKIESHPIFQKIWQLRVFGYTTIIFSTMCLESLINDYGIINTSVKHFTNYLDKLDLISKWIILPKIICGQSIDTNGKGFELLKKLVSYRNKMVHPKSKQLISFNDEENVLSEDIASVIKFTPISIQTIKEITNELYKIDSNFYYLENYKVLWDKNAEFLDISYLRTLVYSMINRILNINNDN
ncbi:MAG: hypothetical protein JW976_09310 [Syntrophaceae bacterium]|nr:hypothetical protein [Syntrophaceae bacterium]